MQISPCKFNSSLLNKTPGFTPKTLSHLETHYPPNWPSVDQMTDGTSRAENIKLSWYILKTGPQSIFSSFTFFWRTYCHERKVCQKGDYSACFLETMQWKKNEWKLPSPPQLPWHLSPSSPSSSFIVVFPLSSFAALQPLLPLSFFFLLTIVFSLSLLLCNLCLHSQSLFFVTISLMASSPSAFCHVFLAVVSFPQLAKLQSFSDIPSVVFSISQPVIISILWWVNTLFL